MDYPQTIALSFALPLLRDIECKMFLFNYQAELDAKRALTTLREELAIDVKYSRSLENAASACEMLCKIARTPNSYLGLELIHVLDHPDKHRSDDISAMVAAFIKRIDAQIDHERAIDPTGTKNKIRMQ